MRQPVTYGTIGVDAVLSTRTGCDCGLGSRAFYSGYEEFEEISAFSDF